MPEPSVPYDRDAIAEIIRSQKFDVGHASIREMNTVVSAIEQRLGVRYIHMEFGIPGFPTDDIAIDAEIQALRDKRVSNRYSPYVGIPELKEEAARFVKLFMDLDVPPTSCVPTVGAMQGCFVAMALAGKMDEGRRTILFLEPGFASNKLQTRFLGLDVESVDLYDHRGDKLISTVERLAQSGRLAAVFWSSPNNPSWVVLKERELQGIGRICDETGVLAIEDLAYFGMDTRENYYKPGEPPYQPTIMRYTNRSISIISSSKVFSYAGQRCALMVAHPELMEMTAPNLERWCGTDNVGHALLHGILYPMMSCVAASPQYGLLALLRAVNRGETGVFTVATRYAHRAKQAKRTFMENGFQLVYDNDLGEPLADGFYFTIAHPAFDSGAELLQELLHYGISAITLETTGSTRMEGLRACVSLIGDDQFEVLAHRLRRFQEDHPVG
jgi:aspartate/methionine/tyrosine aminotransferase